MRERRATSHAVQAGNGTGDRSITANRFYMVSLTPTMIRRVSPGACVRGSATWPDLEKAT
jgi:hypothetical protein